MFAGGDAGQRHQLPPAEGGARGGELFCHRAVVLLGVQGPILAAGVAQHEVEDGALHAEKYYRTVTEEFAASRPAFRWRQLVALARVTTSEYGFPAPGYAEACRLLGV